MATFKNLKLLLSSEVGLDWSLGLAHYSLALKILLNMRGIYQRCVKRMVIFKVLVWSSYKLPGVDFIIPFTLYAKLLRSAPYFYIKKSFSKMA